jgi:PAS domain S-box-containing protein
VAAGRLVIGSIWDYLSTKGPMLAILPRCARLAGVLTTVVGLLVLAGWWTGSEVLVSIRHDWPPMMPLTALLLALEGLALGLVAVAPARRWARAAATVCAGAACAAAALVLLEYVTGASLGVDQIVTATDRGSVARFPGRPAPNSAVASLLAGLALLGLAGSAGGRARGARYAQVIALACGAVTVFALLGYVFGVPELYSFPGLHPQKGMAVHSAAALLGLSAGVLAARPAAGLMSVVTAEHAGGVMARRLLPSLLAFLPVAVVVLLGERQGWYDMRAVTALLALLALIESAIFVLLTARRLNQDDAARKAAEARSLNSERRLRELFDHASDGILVADLDGRYTDANGAACRLLGLPREEVLRRNITDIIMTEEVPRLWAERDELLGGGTSVSEWTLKRSDGTLLPVEVSAHILADGRWQGFLRDISERKRVERELAEAREIDRRLRGELEQVTSASMTVSEVVADLHEPDISTVLQTVALQAQMLTRAQYVAIGIGNNPEAPFEPWVQLGMQPEVARATGRPPRPVGVLGAVAREGKLLRLRDLRRHPAFGGMPQHHPHMTTFLGVPIRHRGRIVGNLYLANKQGAAEFSDEDERLIEMLSARAGVAIETARLYASEATQRAWLQATIDQMPEGVALLDRSGHPVAMNRAILALTCGEAAGVRDRYGNPAIFDIRTPDGRPLPFERLPVVRALEAGELIMAEELMARVADGHLVPIAVNAAPVRDARGEITGAIAVVQDVTVRKELERLREEWASIVAHDLRQPAAAISLTAETLFRIHHGELPERERRAFDRIKAASERLNRMINDLLDVSLIEAKRLSLQPRAVDLGALVDAVVEGLRETPAARRILVGTESEQIVWIDPDRIHQVLGNLISNAIKYGEPDGEIRVQAAGHDETVEVTVTNAGAGIAPGELPALFDRFRRSAEARAGRTPGLGLGLYIAKGLIEAQGGQMWADSVPGESTTFHFTVPRAPLPRETKDASPVVDMAP